MFNSVYFLAWAWLFASFIVSVVLCRKYGAQFTHNYVKWMLWGNFTLHFAKMAIYDWNAEPAALILTRLTPENLCAVLIIASPFLFHFGGVYGRDYMFYVGIISAIVVFLFPTSKTVMNTDLTQIRNLLELIRFYLCHTPLLLAPILMASFGFHRLDYHRLWAIFLFWGGAQTIIFLDHLLIKATGWWYGPGQDPTLTWAAFFYREGSQNQSCTFGPPEGMDPFFGWLYPYLPGYLVDFKVGDRWYFTPVIWSMPFVFLVSYPVGMLLSLPWERRHIEMDFEAAMQRLRMKRSE